MSWDEERKVSKVVITFDDGSVVQTNRFNMSAEEHITTLEEHIEGQNREIKRLEALVKKKERDDQWVTVEKYNQLLGDHKFQEQRLKHFAEAIMDTRMGYQKKVDELQAKLTALTE